MLEKRGGWWRRAFNLSSLGRLGVCLVGTLTLGLSGCATTEAIAKPNPPTISAARAETVIAEQTDANWGMVLSSHPNAVRPDVQRVRIIDQTEFAVTIADCMVANGFPDTKALPDNGIASGQIPQGQDEAQAIAMYTCEAKYPVDAKYFVPLNQSQLKYLYEYSVGELTACLEKNGIRVPTPPSLQTFLDGESKQRWSPYVAVNVGEKEWFKINVECPQRPTDLYG